MANTYTIQRLPNELIAISTNPKLLFLGATSEKDQKIMASERKLFSFMFF